jgi:hypothetical protein
MKPVCSWAGSYERCFFTDYFVNDAFRRELLRVLNRGEAVNALKRAIYTGRVAVHQARRDDAMQAVADALSLLANIVMAWNTAQMQAVIDRWNNRRREQIPAKLMAGSPRPASRASTCGASSDFPSSASPARSSPLRSSKTGANAR